MAYNFSTFKTELEEVRTWLQQELQGIRTGRATPTLLDSVGFEAYGVRTHIQHAATIGVEDARTLRVSPYDIGQVKEIEKAIAQANLGVGVQSDGKTLRVSFPELTSDVRATLIKTAKQKLEEARTRVKRSRDDTQKDIDAQEKEGAMSEDEKFKAKEDMQKLVDESNKALEALFDKKETELTV